MNCQRAPDTLRDWGGRFRDRCGRNVNLQSEKYLGESARDEHTLRSVVYRQRMRPGAGRQRRARTHVQRWISLKETNRIGPLIDRQNAVPGEENRLRVR